MSTSTQLETSSAELRHSPCQMPPELISLILTKLWEESHSPDERSTLLKNIVLVNHTWLMLIAPIVSRDVHIANRQRANVFLGRLPKLDFPGDWDLFNREANRFANEICRSLTFYVNRNTSPSSLTSKDTPATWSRSQISDTGTAWVVLYIVNAFDRLPNLRRISFRYTDWAYDDIFQQLEVGSSLPRQVTHLSIKYSFTTSVWAPALNESAMILRWSSGRCPFAPSVRHLSLSGVTTAFVVAMLRVCPNVETLEITDLVQLGALAPLPPAVRTLVLCHPGIAVSRKTMDSWALSTALDAGLFPDSEGKKLPVRIVVRSGTPDPAAFIELRRSSKDFNAELVYERDDRVC